MIQIMNDNAGQKVRLIIIFGMMLIATALHAQVYVSPAGSDSGNGTIDSPYRTLTKAMSIVTAGGTIYLRGGVYSLSATFRTNKSGTTDHKINLWAYPGETPVLDFSSQSRSTSSRGIHISNRHWYVKGLVIHDAGDNGIYISSDSNIVEGCTLFENEDTGLQISGRGSYNLIINCDSYANYDSASHGENADGFAPKLDVGPGNVFKGCRAWGNSDDGWDMYQTAYPVVVDSCWAFHNGYNIWGDASFQGDGNGFKVGGDYVPAQHIVRNCIAFDNKQKGFDQNNNTAGVTLYNCTGWRNNRNFAFNTAPTTGQHVLKNNISYAAIVQIAGTSVQENNSWQGFTVTDADFVSIDTALAVLPRNADGSLQETGFLRLSSTSSLIDAGQDVGLPYNGIAPDLGAYEYEAPGSVKDQVSVPAIAALLQNFPNPFNPGTTISYTLRARSIVTLSIYDTMGRRIALLIDGEERNAGDYTVRFDASRFASGVYTYRLGIVDVSNGEVYQDVKKMIFNK